MTSPSKGKFASRVSWHSKRSRKKSTAQKRKRVSTPSDTDGDEDYDADDDDDDYRPAKKVRLVSSGGGGRRGGPASSATKAPLVSEDPLEKTIEKYCKHSLYFMKIGALTFDTPGLRSEEFPSDRAAVAKYILDGKSIFDLFPARLSPEKSCLIRSKRRVTWDHQYFCEATIELDKSGHWRRAPTCSTQISGRDSYVRHVRSVHLRAGRTGLLQKWAAANQRAVGAQGATEPNTTVGPAGSETVGNPVQPMQWAPSGSLGKTRARTAPSTSWHMSL
ncbi:hypothetical protein CPB86DRAFT_78285 [Serendipita vermifera]|nr:hypothetical protein CPB86DRAFT_78285 [Serendipita vermifera]